jgi:hypothetical protein
MPHLGPKAFDAAVLAFLRQQPATAPEVLAHLYANYGDCTNPDTFRIRLRMEAGEVRPYNDQAEWESTPRSSDALRHLETGKKRWRPRRS